MIFTLPSKYEYLTKTTKVICKGKNLRTVYLLHIIDHIITDFTNDKLTVSLYSKVMKHLYGNNYSDYVEYLIETGFMKQVSKYSTSNHSSNSYKLIDTLSEVMVYKKNDYKLIKNLTSHFQDMNQPKNQYNLIKNVTTHFQNLNQNKNPYNPVSPITIEIQQKLIEDLQFVTIDLEESIKYIENNIKKNTKKYIKNLSMIHKISDNDLFNSPDEFGRFHSNFTNLKSEIRNNYLKIDGQTIGYLDIKSSQPFFLSQLLKKDPLLFDIEEVQRFIRILEDDNQDIYNQFVNKYPEYFKSKDPKKNRKKSKKLVIMSLFDRTSRKTIYKETFKKEYPFIFDYMNNYSGDSLQELWSSLQRMESEFIFKKVYKSIINQFPEIKLFTVHDSIYYPIKYHDSIKVIWDKYRLEMTRKK